MLGVGVCTRQDDKGDNRVEGRALSKAAALLVLLQRVGGLEGRWVGGCNVSCHCQLTSSLVLHRQQGCQGACGGLTHTQHHEQAL